MKTDILLTITLLLAGSACADAASAPPKTAPEIIDTHLHAYACQPDGLDKAAQWMRQNGVARAIVHPLQASLPTNEEQHRAMIANYAKYKGTIFHFCIFTPAIVSTVEEAVQKLEKEKKEGAIGFGEHYGVGLMFDDPANMRLYTACATVGLPVMFHMGRKENMDLPGLPHLEAALKAKPTCMFIAHGPLWWQQFGSGTCDRLLAAYPNLYADISAGSGSTALNKDRTYSREFLIRRSDKLLFGSDCGWWAFNEKAKPVPQFALMENLDLSDEVKQRIYHGNAIRLFGFVPDSPTAQIPSIPR